MHVPDQLVQALAPWQAAYADSRLLETSTVFVHLTALLYGGGTAVAADRGILQAFKAGADARQRALGQLMLTHRTVLLALAFSLLSGLALVTADIETFFASPFFAFKLLALSLLVVNGALLTRTERRLRSAQVSSDTEAEGDERLWRRLRFTSRASLALWTATLLAGVLLVNFA